MKNETKKTVEELLKKVLKQTDGISKIDLKNNKAFVICKSEEFANQAYNKVIKHEINGSKMKVLKFENNEP